MVMSPEDWVEEVAEKIESIRIIRSALDDFIYSLPYPSDLIESTGCDCCGPCDCPKGAASDSVMLMEKPEVFAQLLTMKADIVKSMLPILVTNIDEFLALLTAETDDTTDEGDD